MEEHRSSAIPQIQNVLSIVGFSLLDGGTQSNAAFLVMRLKPFDQRTAPADKAQARDRPHVRRRCSRSARPSCSRSTCRRSSASPPRGGFEYQLQNLEGRDPVEMGGVHATACSPPPTATRALARVFSTFTADHAVHLSSTSTATRRRRSACHISDVFTALQATLGGIYVNDFNLYGRTWQVNIQGEAADRTDISDIWQIYDPQQPRARWCRCARSPTRASCSGRRRSAATTTTARSRINGAPGAGRVLRATRWRRWRRFRARTLPPGYSLEWTGTAYQEVPASGQTGYILGARGAVRLPVPGGALRELGDPDPGAALGHGRRARRVRRACCWPGCRSISTRRSAWWC